MIRSKSKSWLIKLNLFFQVFLRILFCLSIIQAQFKKEVSKKDTTCHEKGARILILGTFHFDNPGLDSVNVQADDVLSEKRQAEIAILLDKLTGFKPTKIAIEAPYKSIFWQERYQQYLHGKYKLGRNEIEQIGFQLAKRLNLTTLYPIDYPMFMSGLVDDEIEEKKSNATRTKISENKISSPRNLTEEEKKFIETPIVKHLININREDSINKSHEQYLTMLLPNFENPAIYERADRVTNWYKRNLRMFSNLNRITEFNGKDRILLIVGSGHLKLMNGFAIDSPQFCWVEAETYLKK